MRAEDLERGTIIGTPGYTPPEQWQGKAEPRSDLFALAATLYHLATGKEPYGAATADAIDDLLNDPAKPIPDEYRWFFELLKINLAADPNDRYGSAREFKADLQRQCVTKEVKCPQCRAVNPVRTPYCRQCAAALTTALPPCKDCGKSNCMGSRFCIHCGLRLR